jgi:hypothetical protein
MVWRDLINKPQAFAITIKGVLLEKLAQDCHPDIGGLPHADNRAAPLLKSEVLKSQNYQPKPEG